MADRAKVFDRRLGSYSSKLGGEMFQILAKAFKENFSSFSMWFLQLPHMRRTASPLSLK